MSRRLAYLMLAAIVVIWGCNWPLMKMVLEDVPPFSFAVVRMLLGVVSIFGLLAWMGQLRLPPRGDWPVILSVGFLQMGLFMALVNSGLQVVDAGRSAVLAYTTPLWVAPGAAIFLKEDLKGLRLLGAVLGLCGFAFIFSPESLDWTDLEQLLGNGLLMMAAVFWAAAILHVRGHRWVSSPLDAAGWQMLVALVPLLALMFTFEEGFSINWTPRLGLLLFYNGPLATAFCFWASVQLAKTLPAVETSIGFLFVPLMGVASSMWWLGEGFDPLLMVGFLVILCGVILLVLGERRRSEAKIVHYEQDVSLDRLS